jgi:ornithine cyclodeaminase
LQVLATAPKFAPRPDNKDRHERVVELGTVIENPQMSRRGDQQISIADLTGVAVQNLAIAVCVYEKAREQLER